MAGADKVVCPFFVVEFERLKSLIDKDHIKKLGPLVEELEKLYTSFCKIKKVLNDAEKRQFSKEEEADGIRFWLRKLKNAAYKADDIFDDFEYEEGLQQLASEEATSSSNNVSKLHGKIQKLNEIFHELAEECSGLELQKEMERSVVVSPDRITTSLVTEPQVYGICNGMVLGSLRNLPSLHFLEISGFAELEYFPSGELTNLTALHKLIICNCRNLKALPVELISLVTLTELEISYCTNLVSLAEEREGGLKNLSSLKTLEIKHCIALKRLPELDKASLVTLKIEDCPKMEFSKEDFEHLPVLEELQLFGLPGLTWFPEGIKHSAATLRHLEFQPFPMYCAPVDLPDWIGTTLTSLEYLEIAAPKNWKMLPQWMQHLTALKRLTIWKCDQELVERWETNDRQRSEYYFNMIDHVQDVYLTKLSDGLCAEVIPEDTIFVKVKSVADIQPNKQDLASIKMAYIQLNEQDLASIKGKLDSRSPSSSSAGWCICRVPTKFREVNEYAYTPEIISIGPFHCDKKELKGMEVHKLRYVNSLLSRFEDRATKLEECVEAISRLEDEARKCYSEPIELNKEEFVEMMIVDGLFIIELFRKNAGEGQIDKDDHVFNNVWGLASLVRDLILLENQLPMLVLERLFNITMASQQGGKRLSELAIRFFNPLMQREETVLVKYFETGGDHLLDILSKTFYDFPSQQLPHGVKSVQVPAPSFLMKGEEIVVERAPSQGEISTSSMVKSEPELEFKDVPSLTELRDSGVKFKKGNNTFSFLNINFCNGVIEIPPILIRDQNFSFIRNVIAYEQGLVGHPAQMTSYVVLMNNLVQTSNDVAFLREHGIIRNYLSDDELVSSQFQKLHNEINLANFHHSKLCIDVNAFRVTYIQKATGVLKNVYRRVVPTRWVLLAAGFLLTFDAFKHTLATTECTPDLYLYNWQRLDFLSHVILGVILIVMFWSDSY